MGFLECTSFLFDPPHRPVAFAREHSLCRRLFRGDREINPRLNAPFLKGGRGGLKKLLRYQKRLKPLARALRRDMTDCERKLWSRLRGKQLGGLQFYRQKPLGEFIVDFYCPSAKLVIEVDGGQHFTEVQRRRDQEREQYLAKEGLRMVRISNLNVIQNMGSVLEMIHSVLCDQISPNPSLLKRGTFR